MVKLWNQDSGDLFTSIETSADSADVCVLGGAGQNGAASSGLLALAGEQERIMCYFIPELGPAPKWCHYLDSITEELDKANDKVRGRFTLLQYCDCVCVLD